MAGMVRSRILRTLCASNGTRAAFSSSCSSSSSTPLKVPPIAASGANMNDQRPFSADTSTPAPSNVVASPKKSWGILKFGIFSAVAGSVGATAYATYAFSADELEEKLTYLRSSASKKIGEDASGFERFQSLLYSTALKVPVKTLEVYLDIRRSIEEQVRGFTEPSSDKLLPDLYPQEQHIFTLVLDLNETLVYSDWTRERGWRTFKRPGVEAFLEHLAQFYEIVVYSDQLNMYVDPVVDRLDQKGCIRYRLSRAATRYINGKHYRDLSKLNRDPAHVLYVSGHCRESTLQPENCVPVKPWTSEADDTALIDLIPFLEYVARNRPADVRQVLASYEGRDIATEFIERSKEYQRRMQEQKQQGRFWRR